MIRPEMKNTHLQNVRGFTVTPNAGQQRVTVSWS